MPAIRVGTVLCKIADFTHTFFIPYAGVNFNYSMIILNYLVSRFHSSLSLSHLYI